MLEYPHEHPIVKDILLREWVFWNNGLINALRADSLKDIRNDYSWWGRLIENAVDAHLLNHLTDFPPHKTNEELLA
jgi:hypothetical protein